MIFARSRRGPQRKAMVDLSPFGLSPEVQAMILQGLLVASAVLPVLERIAVKTANSWDNKIVAVLRAALSFAPRIKLGR